MWFWKYILLTVVAIVQPQQPQPIVGQALSDCQTIITFMNDLYIPPADSFHITQAVAFDDSTELANFLKRTPVAHALVVRTDTVNGTWMAWNVHQEMIIDTGNVFRGYNFILMKLWPKQ